MPLPGFEELPAKHVRERPAARHRAMPILRSNRHAPRQSYPAPPPPVSPVSVAPAAAAAPAVASRPAIRSRPLAQRLAPHPIPPPDIVLIRAAQGWPGAAGAMAFALAGAMLWRLARRRRRRQALPDAVLPGALLIASAPPPAEPRPPRRADCADLSPEPLPAPSRGIEPDPTSSPPPIFSPKPGAAGKATPTARAAKSRRKPPRPLDESLSLRFEPLRFSATLAHAVLHYRLSLTNGGEAELGPLSIAADMIAAMAAEPNEALTAEAAALLPERHTIATLAPGDTAELRGELRLPLKAITPIRVGQAALMVPLVLLKVEARIKAVGRRRAATVTRLAQFLVGEPDEGPAGKLHPYRLDLGPCSWAAAAQGGLDLVA
jgi:hypothetical protein